MPSVQFYLLGQDPSTGHEIEVNSSEVSDYDSLRLLVAGYFAVLEPNGKSNARAGRPATKLQQESTSP
jgi:hypothetical protein